MVQTGIVKQMQRTNTIQREIGWAKVFLAFLKEAETESDQIRLRGMGIQWISGPSPHHGSDRHYRVPGQR